jgi:hypothetical protein
MASGFRRTKSLALIKDQTRLFASGKRGNGDGHVHSRKKSYITIISRWHDDRAERTVKDGGSVHQLLRIPYLKPGISALRAIGLVTEDEPQDEGASGR